MQKLRTVIIILFGILSFSACEKDDICVDGNTPLMVIRFYDIDDPTAFKAVPALRIVGEGKNITVNTFADRSALDSIGIPLKIDAMNTGFTFIVDSADDENNVETGNSDLLTFNYEAIQSFKSRACGFITTYEKLDNSLESDADNWIKKIEIVNPLVENSAEAHVKIFH